MATDPLSILYIMQRRISFLLSSRLRSMLVTLDLLRCLCRTYLAARRWTISSLSIFLSVYGSHTVLAYSTIGRTRLRYAFCLSDTAPIFRFLLRKPVVWFAFTHIFCMGVSHLRSSVIVSPRYLANCTLARMCSYKL